MAAVMQIKNVSLDKRAIQQRISDARVVQGYSYDKLSEKTGISKGQLYTMEHNFKDGTALIQVLSVAKALHIDITELCAEESR